uniref:DNA-directed primase/polymerase protein n=2 Tax=Corethron hystrix TaxID=216773 RepID=A0A7S1FZF7_9STRA|mmetsp:Transcript_40295/g.94689  ORF Transcript_40295/g.94689 Transcript_40295/m.94689 type:complete len:480 (+) Transcript_40295:1109-2548(+)
MTNTLVTDAGWRKQRKMLSKYLFVRPPERGKQQQEPEEHKNGNNGMDTPIIPPDRTSCLIDLGVYTRNRLFRILGSLKHGKPTSAALHIARTNTHVFPRGFGNDKFYISEPEMPLPLVSPSLSCKPSSSCSDDENDEHFGGNRRAKSDDEICSTQVSIQRQSYSEFRNSMDWSAHARALADTLVVPLYATKVCFPIVTTIEMTPKEGGQDLSCNRGSRKPHGRPGRKNAPHHTSRSSRYLPLPSPYPSLDEFISTKLASRKGIPGTVRSFSYMAEDVLTYHIAGNRWCDIVGRAHKSNQVYWKVDLVLGTCVQGCWDPECRMGGNRGGTAVIPPEILEKYVKVNSQNDGFDGTDDGEIGFQKSSNIGSDGDKADLASPPFFDVNESFERGLLKLEEKVSMEHTRSKAVDSDLSFERSLIELEEKVSMEHTKKQQQKLQEEELQGRLSVPFDFCTSDDEHDTAFDEALLRAIELNPKAFP